MDRRNRTVPLEKHRIMNYRIWNVIDYKNSAILMQQDKDFFVPVEYFDKKLKNSSGIVKL